MADYHTHTVVEPFIPQADFSPIEALILSAVFDSEIKDGQVYFFAEEGPNTFPWFERHQLIVALNVSADRSPFLTKLINEALHDTPASIDGIEIDLSDCWPEIFQHLIARSKTLVHVIVTKSYTCSKMRPDGFGGSITIITKDDVYFQSTDDIVEEWADTEIAADRFTQILKRRPPSERENLLRHIAAKSGFPFLALIDMERLRKRALDLLIQLEKQDSDEDEKPDYSPFEHAEHTLRDTILKIAQQDCLEPSLPFREALDNRLEAIAYTAAKLLYPFKLANVLNPSPTSGSQAPHSNNPPPPPGKTT